jgi:hypothetical protein
MRRFHYTFPIVVPSAGAAQDPRLRLARDPTGTGLFGTITYGPYFIRKENPVSEVFAMMQMIYSHSTVKKAQLT